MSSGDFVNKSMLCKRWFLVCHLNRTIGKYNCALWAFSSKIVQLFLWIDSIYSKCISAHWAELPQANLASRRNVAKTHVISAPSVVWCGNDSQPRAKISSSSITRCEFCKLDEMVAVIDWLAIVKTNLSGYCQYYYCLVFAIQLFASFLVQLTQWASFGAIYKFIKFRNKYRILEGPDLIKNKAWIGYDTENDSFEINQKIGGISAGMH